MADARGRRNARPSGGGARRFGRASPAPPGRGSRAGAGPARASRRSGAPTGPAGNRPAVAERSETGSAVRNSGAKSQPGDGAAGARVGRTERSDSAARTGLTGRAAILALVIAALVISYASSLRAWSEQRSRLAELRAERSERSARVADLAKELTRWHDPAYVETQARQRFGWVMPGEVGYVVVGADDPAPTAAGGEAAPTDSAASRPAWWSELWGSVEQAGSIGPTGSPSPRPKPATTIDPGVTRAPRQR